jgi:3-methyladenine DNA glycosylase AlkD
VTAVVPATRWSDDVVVRLVAAFASHTDPERAEPMQRYMRDQFPFLGIATPERRRLARTALDGVGRPSQTDLLAMVDALWRLEEREYQYAAVDLCARHWHVLGPSALDHLAVAITTKSWWDTVDALASKVCGPIVQHHRESVTTMDRWIDADGLWLVRTAILHQLGWKADTDAARLFRYCERRARHPDFFIRKAIGWALRDYARTDPDGVRHFLETRRDLLSPLSLREAAKHL